MTTRTAAATAARIQAAIYEGILDSNARIARGQVWCTVCGRTVHVDAKACLRDGWPRCCKQTMTVDSPEERAR